MESEETEIVPSTNGFQKKKHHRNDGDMSQHQGMEEEDIQDPQFDNHPADSMTIEQQSTSGLTSASQTRILQFRHYRPRLRALKHIMIPSYDPSEHMEWINAELMTIVEEGLTDEKSNAIAEIQQRKVNWDNRRDLEPAVNELKRRTRVAINKLIKEKIAKLEAENADESEG